MTDVSCGIGCGCGDLLTVDQRRAQVDGEFPVAAGFSCSDDIAVGIPERNDAVGFRRTGNDLTVCGEGEIGWRVGRCPIRGRRILGVSQIAGVIRVPVTITAIVTAAIVIAAAAVVSTTASTTTAACRHGNAPCDSCATEYPRPNRGTAGRVAP
ncbi:hypothetical protein D3C80_1527870 [compost metagenome]